MSLRLLHYIPYTLQFLQLLQIIYYQTQVEQVFQSFRQRCQSILQLRQTPYYSRTEWIIFWHKILQIIQRILQTAIKFSRNFFCLERPHKNFEIQHYFTQVHGTFRAIRQISEICQATVQIFTSSKFNQKKKLLEHKYCCVIHHSPTGNEPNFTRRQTEHSVNVQTVLQYVFQAASKVLQPLCSTKKDRQPPNYRSVNYHFPQVVNLNSHFPDFQVLCIAYLQCNLISIHRVIEKVLRAACKTVLEVLKHCSKVNQVKQTFILVCQLILNRVSQTVLQILKVLLYLSWIRSPQMPLLSVVLLSIMLSQPVESGPRYSARIVNTASGAIRGIIVELNSRHLEPVEVFRGIPYAAPPAGPLRLKAPQLPARWTNTRLAESYGAVCPQKPPDLSNRTAALQNMPKARYNYLKKFIPLLANYSEDCLYLNIYVPGNGNRGSDAPYAVVFFIHGESFEWGAGNPYDGSVVAAYGHVIFVTVNFRLGLLGFLRTRPISSKGGVSNLALLDLVAALKWIRTNIAGFGGDASRVTVIGHGTGAVLTNLLLVLPSARGLFCRAALFSGSALSPWATALDPDSLRKSVAEQFGCSYQNDEDISSCLRDKSVEALLNVQTLVPTVRFMSRFAPTLPLEESAGSAGLMTPALAMERASDMFVSCQLFMTVASTESYADFSASDIQYGFEEEQRNRVLRTYIRNAYVYHLNEIFSAVRNEYTDWDKPIQHPINIRDSTLEALSDGHTVAPLVRVAYLHARRGSRTYLGHFGYQSKDSDFPQRLGTVRGEDVAYITGLPLVIRNFSRQDLTVSESLLTHLSNFVKSGDPNMPTTGSPPQHQQQQQQRMKHRPPQWDAYEPGTELYLSITAKPKLKSHYRGHKMALWLNLIPQLHQPGDEDVSMRHHHFHEREQHFYAGAVRAESFTRIPPSFHQSNAGYQGGRTDCGPDTTTDNRLLMTNLDDEDDLEFLQRLASKHYYSYAAALAITIGVGCLLLLLNMIIFAGIYYQKGRNRKHKKHRSSRSSSSPSSDDIAMSVRSHSSPASSSKHQSPCSEKHVIKIYEPPPCYNTLPNSSGDKSRTNREKPVPPVRSSSNPPDVTIKKRVQVQEISV